jgi:hypothetical protein
MVRSEIVIAGLDEGILDFARRPRFRVLGSKMLRELGLAVTRLQAPEGTGATEARGIIAAAFPQAIVDFNHLYRSQASLTVPAADFATRTVAWNAALSRCGTHLRLGMIDSGVDWAPVLAGAQGRSADFLDAADKASSRQHGTAVASLIVGQQDFGLLPRADLYASEIFGVDSDGMPSASATSFAAALNWLLVSKVAIVNVGLSGPPDRLMEIAVARAMERGMHLVAAVGNDGMADSPRYPAAYPGVIGVTAVDARGDALPRANRGAFVMLAPRASISGYPARERRSAGDRHVLRGALCHRDPRHGWQRPPGDARPCQGPGCSRPRSGIRTRNGASTAGLRIAARCLTASRRDARGRIRPLHSREPRSCSACRKRSPAAAGRCARPSPRRWRRHP